MEKTALRINVSGEAKHLLTSLHESTGQSYSNLFLDMYKNSTEPSIVIQRTFDELKSKLSGDEIEETIESLRIILIHSYKNPKKQSKINLSLANEIKQIIKIIDGDA